MSVLRRQILSELATDVRALNLDDRISFRYLDSKLMSKLDYFVYRHIRLDNNEVFYIGIGKKPKKYNNYITEYSRAYRKTGRNKYWNNIINKTEYCVEILFESDNLEKIIEKEKEFILLYGRNDLNNGSLVNMTEGGEGAFGRFISSETRDKIRQKNTENYNKGLYTHLNRNGSKFYSKESLEKMRKPREKKWKWAEESRSKYLQSYKTRKKPLIGNCSKPILVYDLENIFLKEYHSIKEVCEDLNIGRWHISDCCNGVKNFYKNYIFKYKKNG